MTLVLASPMNGQQNIWDLASQNSPIQRPQRTTLGQAAADVKRTGLIPSYQPVAAGSVSQINTNALPQLGGINQNQFQSITPQALSGYNTGQFGNVQGFDDNYYNNLSQQASKRLQERYFTGPNSLKDNLTATMNKRGLIGSGIDAGATSDLYRSFGDEMADFESQLASERAQNDLSLAKENRQFGFDVAKANTDVGKFNIQNLIDAAKSNRDFSLDVAKTNQDTDKFNVQNLLESILENKKIDIGNVDRNTEAAFKNEDARRALAELGLSAASDESRYSTDFATKMYDSSVKEKESQDKYFSDIINSMLSSNIDPQDKGYAVSLFNDILGNKYGYTVQDYLDAKNPPPPALPQQRAGYGLPARANIGQQAVDENGFVRTYTRSGWQ